VKGNVGHLKAAAGIAGVIKAVLAAQSGQVPPMPNFVSPADGVDLEHSPFVVNQRVVKWTGRGPVPRRACVDSFGFGGVNYAAIVEQYVPEFYASEVYQAEVQRSEPYLRHYAGHATGGESSIDHTHSVDAEAALRDIGRPLAVVDSGAGDLRLCSAPTDATSPQSLRGLVPGIRAEDLGAPGFRRSQGVRFNYVVGEMAGGIASVDLVVAAANAGMLAFFGSGGLDLATIDAAVCELQARLGGAPFGVNLLCNPFDRELTERTVDLLLRKDVRIASASAFVSVTPAVVRYRARGMRIGLDGKVVARNRVIAKVSSPRVAEQFMSPPPADVLQSLVASGGLSAEEASAAALMPVAEAITGEGDSGGHTDRRPLAVLLPHLLAAREAVAARYDFAARGVELYVGAAGGIGDPTSMRAAFALGADYVLTGTINQTTVEARTSDRVKEMLAEAAMEDVAMAPAADMFELGAQVQVLKRGTLYAQRARRLSDLYHAHNSLEDIPAADLEWLEREVFHQPLDDVWAATQRYWSARDPERLARAEADRKLRMALVFRSYLGLSSRWATGGDAARRSDYQVWCGPAIGVFNNWVRGTWLEPLSGRTVADLGLALLYGTCVLSRVEQLARCGYRVPLRTCLVTPPPPDALRAALL
jgi:PfaD family protein